MKFLSFNLWPILPLYDPIETKIEKSKENFHRWEYFGRLNIKTGITEQSLVKKLKSSGLFVFINILY